jgi:hypothetical protein
VTTHFEDTTEFAVLSDDLGPGTAVLHNFARNREALIMPSRGAADKRSPESGLRTAYSLRHTYICLRLMEGADIY